LAPERWSKAVLRRPVCRLALQACLPEPERAVGSPAGRTVSMSGIDVGQHGLGRYADCTYRMAAPSGNGSAAECFSFTQPMAMPPR
jgi:hypothetical protein